MGKANQHPAQVDRAWEQHACRSGTSSPYPQHQVKAILAYMAGSLPESNPSLKPRTSLWLLQMVPVNRPVPHRKTGEAHAPAASQHQLLVLQELTLNSDSAPFMWLFGQSFPNGGKEWGSPEGGEQVYGCQRCTNTSC